MIHLPTDMPATAPLLALPIAFAALDQGPLSFLDLAGVLLTVAGVAGESWADAQLARFKARHPGQVCHVGLWRFSRHPNYFFEWVIWCGFSMFGIGAPGGALSLISPFIMFWLLNFVTGVPPAEEQSLASKGDLYRLYQSKTNRFFPGRPHD